MSSLSKTYKPKPRTLNHMQLHFHKDALHHAYFIDGDSDIVLPQLFAFIKNDLGIVFEGNPDAHVFTYDTFGIDEGRYVKAQQSVQAFDGGKKIFVIVFNTITHEAQNSLLKVFEEPTAHTHFFLVSNSSSRLLPTLKSRLVIIHGDVSKEGVEKMGEAFLMATLSERVALITEIAEEKDKQKALVIVQQIIDIYAHKKLRIDFTKQERETLQQLLAIEGYIEDRSSSIKMLLEHIAHIFPVGKM